MYINNYLEKIVYERWTDFNGFFDIVMAGVTMPNPDYQMAYFNRVKFPHCYYVFEYIVSGRGYIESDGRRYALEAGDFYFYHKYAHVIYGSDPDEPYRKLWINVGGSLTDNLVESFRLGMFRLLKYDCSEIFTEIHALLETADGSTNPEVMRSTARLFYRLTEAASTGSNLFGAAKELSQAGKIREYIDGHLMRPVALEEIAAANFLSEMHCIRLFREEFGVTPMKYLRRRRLMEARELLSSTELSISDVAEMFNFTDRHHFTNCFKSEFGMSPAEFVRSSRHTK